MTHADVTLIARVGAAFGLSFVLGFERELRGAQAGDRTFALIGTAACAVVAVTHTTAPQAVAGVITGIGFVGGGLLFRGEGGLLKGITSAATLFATASIGVVAGTGHLLLAMFCTAVIIFTLELRHLPVLRVLDARRYQSRFRNDDEHPLTRDE